MKYNLNSKDFSDHEIDQDRFCIKNTPQSAGGALEKGQKSHLSSEVELRSVYHCFPCLQSDLLFISSRNNIVLLNTCDDRAFREVSKVEGISKHRRD